MDISTVSKRLGDWLQAHSTLNTTTKVEKYNNTDEEMQIVGVPGKYRFLVTIDRPLRDYALFIGVPGIIFNRPRKGHIPAGFDIYMKESLKSLSQSDFDRKKGEVVAILNLLKGKVDVINAILNEMLAKVGTIKTYVNDTTDDANAKLEETRKPKKKKKKKKGKSKPTQEISNSNYHNYIITLLQLKSIVPILPTFKKVIENLDNNNTFKTIEETWIGKQQTVETTLTWVGDGDDDVATDADQVNYDTLNKIIGDTKKKNR